MPGCERPLAFLFDAFPAETLWASGAHGLNGRCAPVLEISHSRSGLSQIPAKKNVSEYR
jgi:hypothetical protein